MKTKKLLIIAALASLCLAACKTEDPTPTPQPQPEPEPEPEVEITSNNTAPSGFVDGGTAKWDE